MEEEKKETSVGETQSKSTDKSKSLISHTNSLSNINLLNDSDVTKAKAIITQIMRSKKGGISCVEDGLAIIMRAQDLNLPFSTCLEHVHCINGKTGIDIHIVKALLSRAGVTWDCLKNYTPLYEYTDGFNVFVENNLPEYCVKCQNRQEADSRQKEEKGDIIYVYPTLYFKDFNNNIYKSYQWNSALAIALNPAHAAELAKTGKIPVYRIPNQPVDYVTEYAIHRTINGKEQTSIGSFSFSEAQTAEMFEKDTYKKYPKVLIGHRAFTYAARDIASDLLFGCYETTELKIMSGAELGEADIIDIEAEEININ